MLLRPQLEKLANQLKTFTQFVLQSMKIRSTFNVCLEILTECMKFKQELNICRETKII